MMWFRQIKPLPMNLEEKAPSPQPSPAEREREKGRQREGNAAKFVGSMKENLFRGILSPSLSPLHGARGRHPTTSEQLVKKWDAPE